MNTFVGFNQGQYGDLFICLTACSMLKAIDPNCNLIFGINKKYKDCSDIFKLSDNINDIIIWDGYDDWPTQKDIFKIQELELKYEKPNIFNPMPKHTDSEWYNKRHQTEEFCLMNGLPSPPISFQDFKLNNPKTITQNYICIAPFTSFGNVKNLTDKIINKIVDFCNKNNYELIQLGAQEDKVINGATKFNGSYYDSIIKMLGSKALVSADTGMVWAASAFSHPVLAFYANSFYPNSTTSKNWTPKNKNQTSIQSDTISNINTNIKKYLRKTIDTKTYSKEQQDIFAKCLIGNSGFFLDIGCRTPVEENNTKLLEECGWRGLMFDTDETFIKKCQNQRFAKSFCIDATSCAFIDILKNEKCPQIIDYISLDIDEASIPCLKKILENGYQFKCMTFEHTWDLKDPVNNNSILESRNILKTYGYIALYEDVVLNHGEHAGKPFEDWWINPNFINEKKYKSGKLLTNDKIINTILKTNKK